MLQIHCQKHKLLLLLFLQVSQSLSPLHWRADAVYTRFQGTSWKCTCIDDTYEKYLMFVLHVTLHRPVCTKALVSISHDKKVYEVNGYKLDKHLSFVTLTYRVKSHFMSVLGQRLLSVQASAGGATVWAGLTKSRGFVLWESVDHKHKTIFMRRLGHDADVKWCRNQEEAAGNEIHLTHHGICKQK